MGDLIFNCLFRHECNWDFSEPLLDFLYDPIDSVVDDSHISTIKAWMYLSCYS